MEYVIIAQLSVTVIVFSVKYFGLKSQLQSVAEQLEDGSVKLVTVGLADRDLNHVVQKINILLEQICQEKIKGNISAAALKASIVDMSRDMKTPLTSVIGYLQLAKQECTDARTEEMLQICLERAQYCNTLINDFFELSLIESQGFTPDMESMDAAEEVCEQIFANAPLFDEKGITPHVENFDKAAMSFADKVMLERIIQNLISNSIKYTCGDIYFTIVAEEDIIITVSNTVDGEIDTEHIFDKFYVQDKSRHSGRGIGLYLCRELAEAMGGSIYAEICESNLNIHLKLQSLS